MFNSIKTELNENAQKRAFLKKAFNDNDFYKEMILAEADFIDLFETCQINRMGKRILGSMYISWLVGKGKYKEVKKEIESIKVI